MHLDLIKAFVAVAESGGITKAEQRIHRTQSTISQQIARLEKDLEAPLFDRTKRAIILTEQGEQYLDYARRILNLDQESRALIQNRNHYTIIRVGITNNHTCISWSRHLIAYATQNPTVRLHVKTDQSRALCTQLDEGHLDIIIANELTPPKNAVAYRISTLHWIAANDSTVHRERPLALILYPSGCPYRIRALTALETAGIPWRIAFETSDWMSVCAATQAGLGIALLDNPQDMTNVHFLGQDEGLAETAPAYLTLRVRTLKAETPPAISALCDHLSNLLRT